MTRKKEKARSALQAAKGGVGVQEVESIPDTQ